MSNNNMSKMKAPPKTEKDISIEDLEIATELERLEEMIIADKDRQFEFIERIIKKLLQPTGA